MGPHRAGVPRRAARLDLVLTHSELPDLGSGTLPASCTLQAPSEAGQASALTVPPDVRMGPEPFWRPLTTPARSCERFLWHPSAPSGRRGLGGGARRREVDGALSRDHPLGDRRVDAAGLGIQVPLLLQSDLLLGLRSALEDLHGPARRARVEEVLNHEDDALAIDALAIVRLAGLQLEQPAADELKGLMARRQLLQRVADVREELAGALYGVILGNVVRVLGAQDQLHDDRADHLGGEQLAEEEVADELHVGAHALLPLAAQVLDLIRVLVLLLVICHLRGGHQLLELVLANVQHRGLEGHWLPTVRRWELGEDGLQAEDEVRVGLAVVRLGQSFPEDGLYDDLQLLGVVDLDRGDAVHDRGHVLRADLVQQALDIALELLVLVQRRLSPRLEGKGLLGRRPPGLLPLQRLRRRRAAEALAADVAAQLAALHAGVEAAVRAAAGLGADEDAGRQRGRGPRLIGRCGHSRRRGRRLRPRRRGRGGGGCRRRRGLRARSDDRGGEALELVGLALLLLGVTVEHQAAEAERGHLRLFRLFRHLRRRRGCLVQAHRVLGDLARDDRIDRHLGHHGLVGHLSRERARALRRGLHKCQAQPVLVRRRAGLHLCHHLHGGHRRDAPAERELIRDRRARGGLAPQRLGGGLADEVDVQSPERGALRSQLLGVPQPLREGQGLLRRLEPVANRGRRQPRLLHLRGRLGAEVADHYDSLGWSARVQGALAPL
mmetsp:Transcript_19719/g.43574  ORF Transcript_19719/g.43574 Transcript_19719/m.43574 type:complete len:723 (+) Transcript_19719:163-2331(+)